MLFQTCMTFFLLWRTKEYILKNFGQNKNNGSQWEPKRFGFHLSSIFSGQQKKEMDEGLEQYEVSK